MLQSSFQVRYFLNENTFNTSFSFFNRILNGCKIRDNKSVVLLSAPYSSDSVFDDNKSTIRQKGKISKAMRAYLERAKQHDEFIKREKLEFQIGKRHLANMMGEDPETFTQSDVDSAIEYLFPSGLFEPRARPLMRPPEEVFPQRKAAEFDESGRPFHYLFYTGKPNFYNLLHEVVDNINSLNSFEDKMIRKHIQPDVNLTIEKSGSEWISKEQLETDMMEPLHDSLYNHFIAALDRLIDHPYSYRMKDYINQYRKTLLSQTKTQEVPKPEYGADGRAFITVKDGLRKSARAVVTLRSPGTGKVTINEQGIDYFQDLQPREQILFPLLFTGMLKSVDVEAKVHTGGPSGQAGAIRWAISWGLRSFIDQDMMDKMRLAGLLTRDYRTRERKKPGQAGARKKFTWKAR